MSTPDTGHANGHHSHAHSGEVDFSPAGHGVDQPDDRQPESGDTHAAPGYEHRDAAHQHDRQAGGSGGHGEQSGRGGDSGHGGHIGHVGMFRRLFWVMLVIGLPVVVFSDMFAIILGYTLPDVPLVDWISPVLGTVMYGWGGRPFLTGAVSEINARQPGMMLLVALAITVAFLSSWGFNARRPQP